MSKTIEREKYEKAIQYIQNETWTRTWTREFAQKKLDGTLHCLGLEPPAESHFPEITAGNWVVTKDTDGAVLLKAVQENGEQQTLATFYTTEHVLGNVAVAAAAPDLMQAAYDVCNYVAKDDFSTIKSALLTALRKAGVKL